MTLWRPIATLLAVVLLQSHAFAQGTELFSCLPDTAVCSESPRVFVGESCGEDFYFHRGRIAWPALRAVGPITVSVKTWKQFYALLPLFIEIVVYPSPTRCTGGEGQVVLLAAVGAQECGGVWESIGPIDITRIVPVGSLYRVQIEAFETLLNPPVRSASLACINVEVSSTALSAVTWGQAKQLFR